MTIKSGHKYLDKGDLKAKYASARDCDTLQSICEAETDVDVQGRAGVAVSRQHHRNCGCGGG